LDAVRIIVSIGCMFMRIITELKTCHIYDVVLYTIKVSAHNLLEASKFIEII
jgi:hypothetical protein